jgi:hypothetical protein
MRSCVAVAVCGQALLLSIRTHLTKHATMQFLKRVAIDTCVVCWVLRQEFHKQNTSVAKHCAQDLTSRDGVWILYLFAMVCASIPWSAASNQELRVTLESHPLWLCSSRSHRLAHYRVRKVNTLAFCFILCSSVSIFGTQREHNFRKWSLSDNFMKWP